MLYTTLLKIVENKMDVLRQCTNCKRYDNNI